MKKVAVITGATKGIGKNIAIELAKNNYHIILIARNQKELEKMSNCINEDGGKATFISFDIVKDNIEKLNNKLSVYKTIDVLVNCAGGGPVGNIFEVDEKTFMESVSLKQFGYVKMCKVILPYMKKSESGSIVNIVGTFGKQPNKDFIIGSMINAALLTFTKALSMELGKFNINVNAINPGATKTELWENTLKELSNKYDEDKEIINGNIEAMSVFNRLTDPSDIANAVKFLIKDDSKFITGISINVDGGSYNGI